MWEDEKDEEGVRGGVISDGSWDARGDGDFGGSEARSRGWR